MHDLESETPTRPGTRPGTRPAPLFVADHPALDFLNSHATPHGQPVEWLADGADLLAWMEQAGMLPPDAAAAYRVDPASASALEGAAADARALRDWLRGFVQRHAGQPLRPDTVTELGPLNLLLAEDASYAQVLPGQGDGTGEALTIRRRHRWRTPASLMQPLAAAVADLVCHADFRLVRQCAGEDCSLHFLDRTKAHARRWCSMAACGNRAKAAAHRARRAET